MKNNFWRVEGHHNIDHEASDFNIRIIISFRNHTQAIITMETTPYFWSGDGMMAAHILGILHKQSGYLAADKLMR